MTREDSRGAPRESRGDPEQPSHGQIGRRAQQERPPPTPQGERDTSRSQNQQDENRTTSRLTTSSTTNSRPSARPSPTARTTTRSTAQPSTTATTGRIHSRIPDGYSLAGSPEDNIDADGRDSRGRPFVYVHPDYRKLEAKYGRNTKDTPVWGLAKPLPRVVRPGMKERLRDEDEKGKGEGEGGEVEGYETQARGEEEPATQMEVTPGMGSDQVQQDGEGGEGGPSEQAVFPASDEDSERTARPMETEAHAEGETEEEEEEFLNKWSAYRHKFREPLAEWLATTVAIIIGLCGTLAVSTAENKAGTRISNNLSWGLGYMVGIYIAGGVSGAHLNPAISIVLSVFRGFPARQCGYYIIAQTLGAITAGGIAYCLYRDSILNMGPNPNLGSELGFFTEPQSYVRGATAFFDEFVATAILLCAIFAMGDDNNAPPGAGMHSFIIGLLIFILSVCLGFNTGGSFNPARDFGPRLVALMAGYGGHIFRDYGGWWFWGGWVASITGAIAGAMMYDIFIFVGGESPVNYPPRRRHRAKLQKETKWRRWLGIGKGKVPDLEGQIKDCED